MLGAALIAQYGFNMHPCELCLAQRVPYALIALIGLVAAMKVKGAGGLRKVALVCGLLFLVDAGIAGYHTGVETGVFTGPSACSNSSTGEQTLEEMRAAIRNAQLVPCDQPMAHFLGLSMAAWNMVGATLLTVGVFVCLKRLRKAAV
jgi:disulfide bond formation protein DsbB